MNIGGGPLSKSSKQQFWPILCAVNNIPKLSRLVFAIGIYYSNQKKPESVEAFLSMFINETLEFINSGIKIGD